MVGTRGNVVNRGPEVKGVVLKGAPSKTKRTFFARLLYIQISCGHSVKGVLEGMPGAGLREGRSLYSK